MIAPAPQSQQRAETLRRDDFALRGEIADAIRRYCHSVSPAAVQDSHGVERIYYAGISLDGLADAVFAAITADAAEEITGDEMDAIEAAAIAGKPLTVSASGDVRAAVIEDAVQAAMSAAPMFPMGQVDASEFCDFIQDEIVASIRALSQAPATNAAVLREDLEYHARFLLDRLQEFDPGDFESERDFHGHVAPAIARLRNALGVA